MRASPANLLALAEQRALRIEDLPHEVENARYELIDGSLCVTPLGDFEHQSLALKFAMALSTTAPAGTAALAGVNLISEHQTIVEPDVAVVDPTCLVQDGLGVSPDGLLLVVEITSPSTRRRDLTIKRDLYRDWGVPYLLVDRGTSPHTYAGYGELPGWAGVVRPDH